MPPTKLTAYQLCILRDLAKSPSEYKPAGWWQDEDWPDGTASRVLGQLRKRGYLHGWGGRGGYRINDAGLKALHDVESDSTDA